MKSFFYDNVPSGKSKDESIFITTIKAFIIAPLVFLIIIGAIFLYSGVWPPMVVIESESMQHSDTTSYIGVIDTGDIVIVKGVKSYEEITTYVEGLANGHHTYGAPGDVIIYYREGMSKPVIHRAMLHLDYNSTSKGFDIPSLANIPEDKWDVTNGEKVWWNLKDELILYDIGHANAVMRIDLSAMLSFMANNNNMHGGIITLGDNNWEIIDGTPIARYDQYWMTAMPEPIMEEWIIGKARGELPWFGLMKLWITGTLPDDTPMNSKRNLVASIGVLIFAPIIIDISYSIMRQRNS